MIPLICDIKELKFVKKVVVETADAEIAASDIDLKYEVGTMIEIPRAALTADEIAKEAEFFCFGTNDLTQMTYGFSRDDAGKFLNAYYDTKIFENDPLVWTMCPAHHSAFRSQDWQQLRQRLPMQENRKSQVFLLHNAGCYKERCAGIYEALFWLPFPYISKRAKS